jgi:predicted dienelactone hydrolase
MMKKTLFVLLLFARLSHAQGISGAWTGAASSPTLWGGVSLNLFQTENVWSANGKLQFEGREVTSKVSDLSVAGSRINFKMNWQDHELKFNGSLEEGHLRGVFTTEKNGACVSGDWSLVRLTPITGPVELPAPTGPYAVGRRTFYWTDESRNEAANPEPNAKREIVVYLWYPAARAGESAEYLPSLQALSSDLPANVVQSARNLRVSAEQDTPMPTEPRQIPIVIFSPGAGEKALFYSSLEMDLASHGYAVAAIDHTYDSLVALPEGIVLRPRFEKKSYPSADAERQAMQDRADYRSRDILFVKKMLAELNIENKNIFSGRLDLHRVAVVGHSLGGMAAMRACEVDASVGACVNIDGGYRARPYPSDKPLALHQPIMWLRRPLYVFNDEQLRGIGMTREQFNAEISLGKLQLRDIPGGGLDVQLPHVGINHMDFSDIRLLKSGISPEERAARLLTLQMTRDWLRDFLQKCLNGQPASAALKGSLSQYREAHISVYD